MERTFRLVVRHITPGNKTYPWDQMCLSRYATQRQNCYWAAVVYLLIVLIWAAKPLQSQLQRRFELNIKKRCKQERRDAKAAANRVVQRNNEQTAKSNNHKGDAKSKIHRRDRAQSAV